MFRQPDIEKLFRSIVTQRVLVVGDLMLDEYLCGEITRLSPEALLPVMHLDRTEQSLGGAANVAHNAKRSHAAHVAHNAKRSHAAHIANVAAGIVVGKRGTSCVTAEDILSKISEESEIRDSFKVSA